MPAANMHPGRPLYRPAQDRQPVEKIVTHRLVDGREYRSTLRQVGWLGASGRFYELDEHPSLTEPASYAPMWIEVHAERVIHDEAELVAMFGEPIAEPVVIDGGIDL